MGGQGSAFLWMAMTMPGEMAHSRRNTEEDVAAVRGRQSGACDSTGSATLEHGVGWRALGAWRGRKSRGTGAEQRDGKVAKSGAWRESGLGSVPRKSVLYTFRGRGGGEGVQRPC